MACPAALVLATLAGVAEAQVTAEQQSAIRANCGSDFMSKCSRVTPGGKDALVCLQKNVASLSAACKTAVSATIPAETKPAQAAPAAAAAAAPATAPAAETPAAPVQRETTAAPPPPVAKAETKPSPATKPQQAAKPAATAKPAAAGPPPAPAQEAAAEPTPQQLSAIKFTCRRDFTVYCKGVPAGGAEAVACLQRSAAS
jgi:outer membrane biosynthesis protein TonB